jgi:hypothetical protein
MLKEDNGGLASKGFLVHFELLEGNYPQNFLVLFIRISDTTLLVEIYDYRFASLLISKRIPVRIVDGGIIKFSESLLYFLCEDEVIYALNAQTLHHQHQGIYPAEEAVPPVIKQYLNKLMKKKNLHAKVYQDRLIFNEGGSLTARNAETGKKIGSKKITKGQITDFDCGGKYIACGCRGSSSGLPDAQSEVVVLNLATLEVLARIATEDSYQTSVACTSDGERIVCHGRESSLRILRLEQTETEIGLFDCTEQHLSGSHPDLLRFSPDHIWLFFGNHDGVQTIVSKYGKTQE